MAKTSKRARVCLDDLDDIYGPPSNLSLEELRELAHKACADHDHDMKTDPNYRAQVMELHKKKTSPVDEFLL